MIGFGLACLFVCVLSLADRRAMPWALIVTAGWLAGFAGPDYWPVISFGLVGFTLLLLVKSRPWWGMAVHAIAVMMMLLDLWYYISLSRGVYVGIEYAMGLNVGLALQLGIIGFRGGKNAGSRLLAWSGIGLRRSSGNGVASASEEAP